MQRASLERLVRLRLRAQHLDGPVARDPETAVRDLLAVQAQDVEPSRWSIAMRVRGGTVDDVRRAHDDGVLVRTHVLRPTWHSVHRDDLRWLLALTGPRVKAVNGTIERQVGIDVPLLERSTAAIVAAIAAEGPRTRAELRTALAAHGIEASGQRLAYLVMHAELTAVICSGPQRGAQHTYVLVDDVAPACPRFWRAGSFDRDGALVELAVRFFTGHGPATERDLATWASLTLADVRTAIAAAGEQLTTVETNGGAFVVATAALARRPRRPPSPTVHLLQAYDELLSGTATSRLHDRTGRFVDPDALVFFAHVLLDGQQVGQWRRALRRGRVDLEVALARAFETAETAALQAAADRYATASGVDATRLHVTLLP